MDCTQVTPASRGSNHPRRILPKDPELAQAVLQKEFEATLKEQGEEVLDAETPFDEVESGKEPEVINLDDTLENADWIKRAAGPFSASDEEAE